MMYLFYLNFIGSFIVFGAVVWAERSKHVCDGFFLKIALACLGVGVFANAIKPSLHTATWISCSLAAIVIFVVMRIIVAKLHNKKPVFIT